MADVSGGRARHLTIALAFAVLLAAQVHAAEPDGPTVDLIGTWHVLIHYTDDHSHDPEQLHWDDRVWAFEPSGSRLRWIEYPIVVFQDNTGRFEQLGGARAARVAHGWEPNAAQRAAIASGLEVNSRGQKAKTLRTRGGDGWRSASRSTAASASIVTYVEHWSIDDPSHKPLFRREDVLGSARSENLEGLTEYRTTEVEAGGDVLRGSFQRDGSRRGSFWMRRSGPTRAVTGRAASEMFRFYEKYLDSFGDELSQRMPAIREALGGKAGDAVSDEVRARVRGEIRAAIEASVRGANGDPGVLQPEIDLLSRRVERAVIDAGRSAPEIEQMLKDDRFNR